MVGTNNKDNKMNRNEETADRDEPEDIEVEGTDEDGDEGGYVLFDPPDRGDEALTEYFRTHDFRVALSEFRDAVECDETPPRWCQNVLARFADLMIDEWSPEADNMVNPELVCALERFLTLRGDSMSFLVRALLKRDITFAKHVAKRPFTLDELLPRFAPDTEFVDGGRQPSLRLVVEETKRALQE